MPDGHRHQLIEDTLTYSEREAYELTIEDYRSLRRALHTDLLDVIAAEQSFFVIGSYNLEEKARLEETVEWLHHAGHAFLLDDTLEAWEHWTTHFKSMRTEPHTSSASLNIRTADTSGKRVTWTTRNIGKRPTS